ncbi:MAG: protein phosphatase 2C domain-containing protein [Hyphomicrobiaceae bacterium]
MTSRLTILDRISVASGAVNDDRVGAAGPLAWAIDGATDVLAEPLLPGGSDAAWIAAVADAELARLGAGFSGALDDLVLRLTETAARRFAAERSRAPIDAHEQPSAAALIVRLAGLNVDYVSLADCQCLARAPGEATTALGHDPEVTQGDRRAIEVMQTFRANAQSSTWREARAHLWPRIRAARGRLNTPDGYGVLSVIPPPEKFMRTGQTRVAPGTRLLLATDGFMRLTDLFARYSWDELFDLAARDGLSALVDELRQMEVADGDCLHVPRTKPHDDASAILLEVMG